MGIFDFFSRSSKDTLDQSLVKTKQSLWTKLNKIIRGKTTIDDDVLDQLEELLITSDVGITTTLKIIEGIEKQVAKHKYLHTHELDLLLKKEITSLLTVEQATTPTIAPPLYILLVVGINGVGKTTTIGKLAAQFTKAGKQVVLAAADTFRAAAVEQLKQWGERVGASVVERGMHTDPAAVAYEAVQEALRLQADVVIIDTAGRLHTKVNLMHELSKLRRTVQKLIPEAPHDVLLVLDSSTGQNAVLQAEAFIKATQVTSLAITKLDGSAKGGVVISIVDQFKVPIQYIGVGERIEDLKKFDTQAFIAALFDKA